MCHVWFVRTDSVGRGSPINSNGDRKRNLVGVAAAIENETWWVWSIPWLLVFVFGPCKGGGTQRGAIKEIISRRASEELHYVVWVAALLNACCVPVPQFTGVLHLEKPESVCLN